MASVVGQRWEVYEYASVSTRIPNNGEMVCIIKPDEFGQDVIPLLGNNTDTIAALFEKWKAARSSSVSEDIFGNVTRNFGPDVSFRTGIYKPGSAKTIVVMRNPQPSVLTPFHLHIICTTSDGNLEERDVTVRKFILDARAAGSNIYFYRRGDGYDDRDCYTQGSLFNAFSVSVEDDGQERDVPTYVNINNYGQAVPDDPKQGIRNRFGFFGAMWRYLQMMTKENPASYRSHRGRDNDRGPMVLMNPAIKGSFIVQSGSTGSNNIYVTSIMGGEIQKGAVSTPVLASGRNFSDNLLETERLYAGAGKARLLGIGGNQSAALEMRYAPAHVEAHARANPFVAEVTVTLYSKNAAYAVPFVTLDVNVFSFGGNQYGT